MRLLRLLVPAIAIIPLTGCPCNDDETVCGPVEETPANITAIRLDAGDQQIGPAGSTLPEAISVRRFDPGNDAPRPGEVVFSIESGGGQLLPAPGFTTTVRGQELVVTANAAGFAAAMFRLGTAPGPNTARATLPTASGNFIRFTATGHGPMTAAAIDGGDGQTGEAGAELATRPAVKVTDAGGRGIPGVRVWFIPADGGLPLDGVVATTSPSGRAVMPSGWTLGPAVGPQHLTARVLEGPTGSTDAAISGNPLQFGATATAPAPASVSRFPTDFPEPQNGVAGQPVAVKPAVRVRDAGGRPLPGIPIRFAVTAGGGQFGGSVIITERPSDANGVVTVPDWILGPMAGVNTVTATVLANGVSGNPVTFTANASAANLTLAIAAGDQQSAAVGTVFPIKPKVRITNAAGAGVAGIRITWSIVQGTGSYLPLTIDTDANGYAEVEYVAGTVLGPLRLRAATTDTRVTPSSVTFTLTITPAP